MHERAAQGLAGEVTPQVTPQVQKLVSAIRGEQARAEIMANLGLKDRMHFANEYLQPALDAGLVEMTIPEKPQSSKQKYRITGAGRALVDQHG
jgi:ATP-dependent DNA helicase RecG